MTTDLRGKLGAEYQNLNPKQLLAVKRINQFISQDTERTFYLIGFAGTGKGYTISKIIKEFVLTDRLDHIFVCAPTHQALNVIESYIRSCLPFNPKMGFESKISFMTIHKLLEFKPVILADDGSKTFKSLKESRYLKQMQSKLIVIDECSMIPEEMVSELFKYFELYPFKVIFMGDNKQLPPVRETESLVFETIPKNYQYYVLLDEIMRTSSPDIKEVCSIIRTWNQTDSLAKLLLPIHNRSKKEFKMFHKKSNYQEATWFKKFIKKMENGDIPIILTWRNATSDFYNSIIRKHVYRNVTDLNNYVVGDYAIFNNFYATDSESFFYTSDMIKILEISSDEKTLFHWEKIMIDEPKTATEKDLNRLLKRISHLKSKYQIDTLTIERVHSDITHVIQGKTYQIKIIHRAELDDYLSMLQSIKEQIEFFYRSCKSEPLVNKLWEIYHKNLVNPYAEIIFGYATTSHKAQGSTFNSVFVDIEDIGENPDLNEMQKMLYTAAGRASCELGFLL